MGRNRECESASAESDRGPPLFQFEAGRREAFAVFPSVKNSGIRTLVIVHKEQVMLAERAEDETDMADLAAGRDRV